MFDVHVNQDNADSALALLCLHNTRSNTGTNMEFMTLGNKVVWVTEWI